MAKSLKSVGQTKLGQIVLAVDEMRLTLLTCYCYCLSYSFLRLPPRAPLLGPRRVAPTRLGTWFPIRRQALGQVSNLLVRTSNHSSTATIPACFPSASALRPISDGFPTHLEFYSRRRLASFSVTALDSWTAFSILSRRTWTAFYACSASLRARRASSLAIHQCA